MTAEPALAVRAWSVDHWRCTLTIPRPKPGQALQACVEWLPRLPPGALTSRQIAQYRAGRDAAIKSLASELGLSFAVVDL